MTELKMCEAAKTKTRLWNPCTKDQFKIEQVWQKVKKKTNKNNWFDLRLLHNTG